MGGEPDHTERTANALSQIDPLNFAVARLVIERNEIVLGHATGFFYRAVVDGIPVHYLVTNWHVLAGRNAETHAVLNSQAATPNRVKLRLILREGHPEAQGNIAMQEIIIRLHNADGDAVWLQHPAGSKVDIAAIPLGEALAPYHVQTVGELAQQRDMAIEIGNDVLILGYPLGFSEILEMPIWKKGVIASEPHAEIEGGPPRILVDATTRNGMSGAPVIMREKTHYLTEAGEIVSKPNATRFVGVYASRPGLDDTAANLREDARERAEIGYVYKSGAVEALIVNQRKGLAEGEVP